MIALWWIRRDLRLADNGALAAALAHASEVVPVFVLDPAILGSADVGPVRVSFLFEGLRRLDADLRARGSCLLLRQGEPVAELSRLARKVGAGGVFAEEDYSPYARRRDESVARELPLELLSGRLVHPPGAVLRSNGTPYTLFTPFSRAWRALPPPSAAVLWQAPDHIASPPEEPGEAIPGHPSLPKAVPFPAGEAEARARLSRFAKGHGAPIYCYAEGRDRLDEDGTSSLSPYLRFGMLSARQAVVAALEARQAAPDERARRGADTWLSELIWREFYSHILYHFPYALRRSFRPDLQDITWANEEGHWAAWKRGQTGYPVVDAAMRQLSETGWMHNRARMVVASFLVKDLLVDWRWGERWFMQHLVDGDGAANNGGWQWAAGTGTDAAPYFRVFNPVLQGQRYDPRGVYVRRWLPELARVPDSFVHEPWKMPDDVQERAACVVGRDYPAPLVDHAWARERTLRAYREARSRSAGGAPRAGELP